MKVFLSYSFNDKELYFITLLAEKLQELNYLTDSMQYRAFGTYSLSEVNLRDFKIKSSNFLIGIITKNSKESNKVVNEILVAKKNKIPYIFLVEKGIDLTSIATNFKIFYFDRKNPDEAIEHVKKEVKNAESKFSSSRKVNVSRVKASSGVGAISNSKTRNVTVRKNSTTDNSMAWLFGGVAVGFLIGAISASGSKK